MRSKLTSRKFWVSVAAMLASMGSAIVGVATGNNVLGTFGVICTALSAGIYAFCEAWVDSKSALPAEGVVIGEAAAQTGLAAVENGGDGEEA